MIKKILFCLAFISFCATANAEGFYAGAGFGITQIEDEEEGISFKDNPFGWRLMAGYDFNDNFAIEGMYVNSGEAEDSVEGLDVKAELKGFAFYLVGLTSQDPSSKFKLFGKLGYYSGEQEVSVFGITLDEDADGFAAGAGFRYQMDDNVSFRTDFDWLDSDLDTLWSVSVGIQVGFGK